jgi:transposase InsO family protein
LQEVRDEVVEFVGYWHRSGEFKVGQLLGWLGLSSSKYYSWRERQGQANQHNGHIPKENWLLDWEKSAIEAYARQHREEGYRRLSYMMLDEDVVAVSPSSVYRVLRQAGLLQRWDKTPSRKGQGFEQPDKPHQHWHIDIAYLNLGGTFYYLCSVLDGYSRYLVHWEIRAQMTETDVEIILQRAREKFPTARPRIISDNGPQFIARDFKLFIRECGMSHVRTSPGYPQSNGKLERWHRTLKADGIRPKTPLTLEDARRIVDQFVRYYNDVRLHSAISYVAPKDRLSGHDKNILTERKRKLAQARKQRQQQRQKEPTIRANSVSQFTMA